MTLRQHLLQQSVMNPRFRQCLLPNKQVYTHPLAQQDSINLFTKYFTINLTGSLLFLLNAVPEKHIKFRRYVPVPENAPM